MSDWQPIDTYPRIAMAGDYIRLNDTGEYIVIEETREFASYEDLAIYIRERLLAETK